MPPNPPSKAHGFAMRSMSLGDMQISKSVKKNSWPPPLPNPGDAPGLKSIKLGKAAGLDGLAAEHFVYSHKIISVHLSLLFTGLLSHGYLPAALMKSVIVSILKN